MSGGFGDLAPIVGVVAAIWIGVLGLKWALARFSTGAGGVYGTIEAFVGLPGQGKTTLAVQWALDRARLIRRYRGRVIIASNIRIQPPEGVEYRFVEGGPGGLDVLALVRLALEARRDGGAVVLLLDEAGICLAARFWRLYGSWLMWLFQQSRKLHIEVVWTAQSETFVDAQLRQLTAATHRVQASPPSTVVSMLSGKRPRWLTVKTYDRTAVGVVDAFLGSKRVRYRQSFEETFDSEAFVPPPESLEGSAELVALLREFDAGEVEIVQANDRDVVVSTRRARRGQWEDPEPAEAVN